MDCMTNSLSTTEIGEPIELFVELAVVLKGVAI